LKSNPENEETRLLYDKYLEGSGSDKSKAFLHTKYHAVEKKFYSFKYIMVDYKSLNEV